jgi:large subunit ribosomal protein L24
MTSQVFSSKWKASSQPRKQRKYQYNASAHTKGSFLNAALSEELKAKHSKNSMRVRVGDKVKVLRGQNKGKIGTVDSVDVSSSKIKIQKVELVRKDGTKFMYPIHASNVQILELKSDKKRDASLKRGKSE